MGEFITYGVLAVMAWVFFIKPFFAAFIRGIFLSCRKPCEHTHAASFHVGHDTATTDAMEIVHCFECGQTSVNGEDFHDKGIRDGDDLNEFLGEIDSAIEQPDFADMPDPLPLPSRVFHLLRILGPVAANATNAVVLGRSELDELFPLLVTTLEREEHFKRAGELKNAGVESDTFHRELGSFRINGLAVIPNYETDSCIALTTI